MTDKKKPKTIQEIADTYRQQEYTAEVMTQEQLHLWNEIKVRQMVINHLEARAAARAVDIELNKRR